MISERSRFRNTKPKPCYEIYVFWSAKRTSSWIGRVGTGKSYLSLALGVEACRRGHTVRFFRVSDLVALLQGKHQAGTLARFQKDITSCDLLILDEVGFVPFHQTGAELLFHVISTCYEQRSVMVTSNLEFGQWNTVFGDNRLTAASCKYPRLYRRKPSITTCII